MIRVIQFIFCLILWAATGEGLIANVPDHRSVMQGLPVIHGKERIWSIPAFGNVAEKNPPFLKWRKQSGKDVRYDVRLSQDAIFSEADTLSSQGIPFALFNPHQLLKFGKWYWQVRVSGEDWSETQQFLITEDSAVWDPPTPEYFIQRLPDYHPRVLVDAPEIDAFRFNSAKTAEAKHIIAEADEYLNLTPPSENHNITDIVGESAEKTDKLQKDASKELGSELFMGVDPLCKAYVLTGDRRYAETAKIWALEAARWDPDGVTRINDFGDSRIMLSMALVYDTLHALLDDAEKQQLLKAVAARGGNFYRDYKNNKEAVVLSNHVWQHIFHYLFDTALAVQGDLPEADEWLTYLYEMFLARAPILGDTDGGWAHGLSYFTMNMAVLVDVPQVLKKVTGFDFIKHTPWYWENTYYFLYAFPPGSAGSGFADNSDDLPEPQGDYLAYADTLSRLVQNPYAAWYRDRITDLSQKNDAIGIQLEDTMMLRWYRLKYLYGIAPAEPKSPESLPKSRVFEGVGLVTMHSQDLAKTPEKNLFLAMRSSPFGTYSHMLADNNSFNLVYGGDRLFYHTGYKVAMNAPHRQLFYKHTKSHNGILIDGQGQPYHTEAYGWIENFLTGDSVSYAVGNASNAYDSESEQFDAGLKTFKRHALMLDPDIVVIYDELEAKKPVDWSFLLHSYHEINLNSANRVLFTDNGMGRAKVHLFASDQDTWTVTDKYEVPAENWRGLRDKQGELLQYPDNAWHFAASTGKVKRARFLAIVQVKPSGELMDYDFSELQKIDRDSFILGNWSLTVPMDVSMEARIDILNTSDGVAFTSSGKELEAGDEVFQARSSNSAILAEQVNGNWIFKEAIPRIPSAAETALKALNLNSGASY